MESATKSPKTIKSYTASVRSLATFLRAHDMPEEVDTVAAKHIRAFLTAEREDTSPAFGQQHHRNLRVYFRWIEAEVVRPFFTEAEITALLRTCSGQDFESRRDAAIIRILTGTGSESPGWPHSGSAPTMTSRPTCSCNCAGSRSP